MHADPAVHIDRQASPDEQSAPQLMIQLATGYRLSQAIYVFTKLGIADLLATGPKTQMNLALRRARMRLRSIDCSAS